MKKEEILERINIVYDGGTGHINGFIAYLKENGIVSGIHVGKDPDSFTPQMTTEWFLGQFISIAEDGAGYAFNSWFNCAEKFVQCDLDHLSPFDEDLFIL